jgi:hypothetical protein
MIARNEPTTSHDYVFKASLNGTREKMINESNRIKNLTFQTVLQRKLRVPIFDTNLKYKCKCGTFIDQYGDHCLGCKVNHKAKASNGIRDDITKVFQQVLPIVNMIDSPTQVEKTTQHSAIPPKPQTV